MPTLYDQAQTFTPDDLRSMASDVADHYDIPKDMFLGLMGHESAGWKATAKNPTSSATGVAQFIDSTARDYFKGQGEISKGGEDPNDPRWHPGYSMDASARYLLDLKKQTGSWEGAIKGYYGSKVPGANDKYLDLIKASANKEAENYATFQKGQYDAVSDGAAALAGAAGLGMTRDDAMAATPGYHPDEQPGQLFDKVKGYLGLNNQPSQPMPAVTASVNRTVGGDTPINALNIGPTPQELADQETERSMLSSVDVGATLASPDHDIVETETQRVMGRFLDGFTAGGTEWGKKAALGDTLMPQSALGSALGQGAYLAGQITGPFKLIKALTGGYLFPTVSGLRTTGQILTQGMREGAVNLGILGALGRVIPGLIENDSATKYAMDIMGSGFSGALVGTAFPMLSLIPGQGVASTGLRMATGFAAMDFMRAGSGKWSTLPAFVNSMKTWDDQSKQQFSNLAYSYLMDLYFARTVRPIAETMAHQNQNAILDEIAKLNPKDLENSIQAATGQEIQPTLMPDGVPEWKPSAGKVQQIQNDAAGKVAEWSFMQNADEVNVIYQHIKAEYGQEFADKYINMRREELAKPTLETPQTVKDINPDVVPEVENPSYDPSKSAEESQPVAGVQSPVVEGLPKAETAAPEGATEMYGGGPNTSTILQQLRDGIPAAKQAWTDLKNDIRDTFAPRSMPEVKDVAQALVTMMGRKNEAIGKAGASLLEFRDLFNNTPVAEWGKIASAWQRGEKSGSDLDRAYEIYGIINKALTPMIQQYKNLSLQDNYLRQAWANGKAPEFRDNLNAFLSGGAFKNYGDLNTNGQPQLYKATFAPDGSYTLDPVGGSGTASPGEGEALTGVPRGKTLTGGRSYFQQKKIADWETGLMLGGKPKFDNLFDLMMFDIAEKNQFAYGNAFIKWAREQGILKYVQGAPPAGWTKINDPMGVILHPYLKDIQNEQSFSQVPGSYDMTTPEQEARVIQYTLVAPDGEAKIINNFLSPGLRGNPQYDLYRSVVDPLRSLGVAFSTFHLRFTMNNSLATGTGGALSKAMGDLFAGDLEAVAKDVASGALNLTGAKFIQQLATGSNLAEAILKGTTDPVLAATVRRYVDTGGTVPTVDSMLPLVKNVTDSLWRGLVDLNPMGGWHPFRGAREVIEASSKPIMTYAVPFAKLGAFSVLDRALSERMDAKYADLPATPESIASQAAEYRDGLFDINKHLDNIYGQMNYDALLINRTMKDLMFFVIKYPGWNIGSGRWLGSMLGGAVNTAIPGRQVSEYQRESLRTGLGLVVNMGIYSSLMYWLINGKPPEDMAELYTKGVWTGGYLPGGGKEYIRDASYWRDLWGMTPIDQQGNFAPGKPIQTVFAKAADIWRIPAEVFGNKEAFNRYQIWTPNDPSKWTEQTLKYFGKQALPYSFRSMAQGSSPWAKYGGFVGFSPSPARQTDTAAMQELRGFQSDQQPVTVTIEKQGKKEVSHDIMQFAHDGDGQGFLAALQQARREGKVTQQKYENMVQGAHDIMADPEFGPLRNSFRSLNDMGEVIKVYSLTTPEERQALAPLMQHKWQNAKRETRMQNREAFLAMQQKFAAEQ